jgi:hypothetical protein
LIPRFWHLEHQQQHQGKKKANSGTKKKKKTWKPRADILPSFLLYVGCGKAVLTPPLTTARRQLLEKSFFSSVPPRTGRQKSVTILVSMV